MKRIFIFIIIIFFSSLQVFSNIFYTSDELADFLISKQHSIESKIAALKIANKKNLKLSVESTSKIIDSFSNISYDKMNMLLPKVLLITVDAKEKNFKVYNSFLKLLALRKDNVNITAYILGNAYRYYSYRCSNDDRKFFKTCGKYFKSDFSTLPLITKFGSTSLSIEYFSYIHDRLKSSKSRREIFRKFWDIYLNADDAIFDKLLKDLTAGSVYYPINFLLTNELINLLIKKADANSKLKKSVSNFLGTFKIPKPYVKTKEWWDENKKSFDLPEFIYLYSLNQSVDDPIDGTISYELMLEDGYKGFSEFLAKKQKELYKLLLDKTIKNDQAQALELISIYETRVFKQKFPAVYLFLIKKFNKLSSNMKYEFILSLNCYVECGNALPNKVNKFLQKIIDNKKLDTKIKELIFEMQEKMS